MAAQTTINADCQHGAWLLRVGGPLDAHGVLRLCASMSRLTHVGTHDIVVDLQPATEADPDALAALGSAARLVERAGLGFALLAPGGRVREAVLAAGLDAEVDERAALERAAATSHRRRRPTSATAEQLVEDAA